MLGEVDNDVYSTVKYNVLHKGEEIGSIISYKRFKTR